MKKYGVVSVIVIFVLIFSVPVFAYSISPQAKLKNAWEQKNGLWERAVFFFSNQKSSQNKNAGLTKVTRPPVVQESEWSQQLNASRLFATSA